MKFWNKEQMWKSDHQHQTAEFCIAALQGGVHVDRWTYRHYTELRPRVLGPVQGCLGFAWGRHSWGAPRGSADRQRRKQTGTPPERPAAFGSPCVDQPFSNHQEMVVRADPDRIPGVWPCDASQPTSMIIHKLWPHGHRNKARGCHETL